MKAVAAAAARQGVGDVGEKTGEGRSLWGFGVLNF